MIRTATVTRVAPRIRLRDASGALIGGGISAGVSLAEDGINEWMNSIQLSHDADSATTAIVNGLGQQLSNLDSAYFAEANPTCADQRAALNAYDQAWAWLQSPQACGNGSYGAAGNRCISDRAPGGKFPWAVYYRDPIASDPRVSGCDTSQQVILPSVTTGAYAATQLTAAAGSASTGTPATSPVPASGAGATGLTANATLSATAGIPTPVLIGGIVLAVLFLMGGK